jgi:hypothetical protein
MTVIRLHHAQPIVLGLSAVIVLAAPVALAQTSVQAMFEKHKLLGTFAWDCSKPANKDNLYFVHRVLDANHVQRDQMSGESTRDLTVIIDKTTEAGPNQLALSGTVSGVVGGRNLVNTPTDGVWRIEPNRILRWEATVDGQKLIANGKILRNAVQVPWDNRCGN